MHQHTDTVSLSRNDLLPLIRHAELLIVRMHLRAPIRQCLSIVRWRQTKTQTKSHHMYERYSSLSSTTFLHEQQICWHFVHVFVGCHCFHHCYCSLFKWLTLFSMPSSLNPYSIFIDYNCIEFSQNTIIHILNERFGPYGKINLNWQTIEPYHIQHKRTHAMTLTQTSTLNAHKCKTPIQSLGY